MREYDTIPYLPILEEFDEVAGDVVLVCSIRFANRESCTDWLFHPKHVGQINLSIS